MSQARTEVQAQSFVVAPLGSRKLALSAESVIELVAPVREQKFPHCTPWLSGVFVRRGRVVPICDVGKLLGQTPAGANCHHLIVEWRPGKGRNWCAIPVAGPCELTNAETVLPAAEGPGYIIGRISFGDEQIEVVDFGKFIQEQESAFRLAAPELES
jgi:chemotaxis signal transduction protein